MRCGAESVCGSQAAGSGPDQHTVVSLRKPNKTGQISGTHWQSQKCRVDFQEVVCLENVLAQVHGRAIDAGEWVCGRDWGGVSNMWPCTVYFFFFFVPNESVLQHHSRVLCVFRYWHFWCSRTPSVRQERSRDGRRAFNFVVHWNRRPWPERQRSHDTTVCASEARFVFRRPSTDVAINVTTVSKPVVDSYWTMFFYCNVLYKTIAVFCVFFWFLFFFRRGICIFPTTDLSFSPVLPKAEKTEYIFCFVLFCFQTQCFNPPSLCAFYCIFCGTLLLWPLWCVDLSFLFCFRCVEFIMKLKKKTTNPPRHRILLSFIVFWSNRLMTDGCECRNMLKH